MALWIPARLKVSHFDLVPMNISGHKLKPKRSAIVVGTKASVVAVLFLMSSVKPRNFENVGFNLNSLIRVFSVHRFDNDFFIVMIVSLEVPLPLDVDNIARKRLVVSVSLSRTANTMTFQDCKPGLLKTVSLRTSSGRTNERSSSVVKSMNILKSLSELESGNWHCPTVPN